MKTLRPAQNVTQGTFADGVIVHKDVVPEYGPDSKLPCGLAPLDRPRQIRSYTD
jgi:hypothetical protein